MTTSPEPPAEAVEAAEDKELRGRVQRAFDDCAARPMPTWLSLDTSPGASASMLATYAPKTVESIVAAVRAEDATGITPNQVRPSQVIIVGARMTEDVLDMVRTVEDGLVLAVRAEQAKLLSDTFLAERDLDPKYFRRIRGRRVNPDYNAGYRMGMEDAARYARGDFTPTGRDGVVRAAERGLADREPGHVG